jgi:hypothetical protein
MLCETMFKKTKSKKFKSCEVWLICPDSSLAAFHDEVRAQTTHSVVTHLETSESKLLIRLFSFHQYCECSIDKTQTTDGIIFVSPPVQERQKVFFFTFRAFSSTVTGVDVHMLYNEQYEMESLRKAMEYFGCEEEPKKKRRFKLVS